MIIVHHQVDEKVGRNHPWTVSDFDEGHKYYDFKKNPELIRTSLEDFLPYSDKEPIETFYKFLEWINGSQSVLETNDCALRYARENISTNTSKKKLEISGRVMIFFRTLQFNCDPKWFQPLKNAFLHFGSKLDPSFRDGVITTCFFPVYYEEINEHGVEISFNFWAFGDSETECLQNLNKLFEELFETSKLVSQEVSKAISG